LRIDDGRLRARLPLCGLRRRCRRDHGFNALRYVLGEVDWEQLNRAPELHIRCDPSVAQFIVDPSFEPALASGAFAKDQLDPDFVSSEEERITKAYVRLRDVVATNLSIADYPLAEVIAHRHRDHQIADL
jgi:hypothetical protein